MELPFCYNFDDFKETYLSFFFDWKNEPENLNKDLEDYLKEYADYLNSVYEDILQNPDNWKITELQKRLRLTEKGWVEFSQRLYEVSPETFPEFENENQIKRIRLQHLFSSEGKNLTAIINNDPEKMSSDLFHATFILNINISEILEFIDDEILKLQSYKASDANVDLKKRHTTPVIMAMLKDLNVFVELKKRHYVRADVIKTLYQIIGTNDKNIEKYYDSMIKGDQLDFKENHIIKAKKFLNSKGY